MLINATVSATAAEETASSVVIDGRTFTFDGTYTIVRHVDGPVAIVSATAVGVTPNAAAASGRDGVMINPVWGAVSASQGYDDRRSNYSAGLNAVGGETSLSPDDIMVATKSETSPRLAGDRDGTSQYQAVYVTASTPSADSLSPPCIGWTGRTSVDIESAVDWDAKIAAIPTYTITPSANRFSYAAIIDRLTFNPGWAQYGAASNQGYEWSCPLAWGGADVGSRSGGSAWNYGRYMMWRVGDSIAALMDNFYTTAQRKEILIRLASAGKQQYKTFSNSGYGADGGHYQVHPLCAFLYLWATGQTAAMNTFVDDAGGNWQQTFFADATYVSEMAPFGAGTDVTDVTTLAYGNMQWTYHRRNISSVSGDNITLPTYRAFTGAFGDGGRWAGDENKGRWRGLVLTDGTSDFLITADLTGDRSNGAGSASITVPGHTFSTGNTVWMKPDYTISSGDPVWGLRGLAWPNSVIPTVYTNYQGLQADMPTWMLVYAIGEMRDSYLPPAEYADTSMQANLPTAAQNWDNRIYPGSNANELYDQHWTTISAISQPNLTP